MPDLTIKDAVNPPEIQLIVEKQNFGDRNIEMHHVVPRSGVFTTIIISKDDAKLLAAWLISDGELDIGHAERT